MQPRLSMSGSITAKGSSPTISRAHHTAWPRPSGSCWRVKLVWPALGWSLARRLELLGLAALREGPVRARRRCRNDPRSPPCCAPSRRRNARCRPRGPRPPRAGPPGRSTTRHHLLRHRLGGGQEAGAETGDGEDGFADGLHCRGHAGLCPIEGKAQRGSNGGTCQVARRRLLNGCGMCCTGSTLLCNAARERAPINRLLIG